MKIIDLTMPICEGMTTYPAPWHPFVEITQLARHGIEGRETRKIVLGSHTGTHIDAPRHFIRDGATLDDVPLEDINGMATVLDLTRRRYITEATLREELGGIVPERLLLRFDGDALLDSKGYYTDQPWIEPSAAQWLASGGCKLLGMDTPMPDNPRDAGMPIHTRLLGQGVILLEYLVNLKSIPTREFELIVAPLKIKGGDGAPVRAFAIVRD